MDATVPAFAASYVRARGLEDPFALVVVQLYADGEAASRGLARTVHAAALLDVGATARRSEAASTIEGVPARTVTLEWSDHLERAHRQTMVAFRREEVTLVSWGTGLAEAEPEQLAAQLAALMSARVDAIRADAVDWRPAEPAALTAAGPVGDQEASATALDQVALGLPDLALSAARVHSEACTVKNGVTTFIRYFSSDAGSLQLDGVDALWLLSSVELHPSPEAADTRLDRLRHGGFAPFEELHDLDGRAPRIDLDEGGPPKSDPAAE